MNIQSVKIKLIKDLVDFVSATENPKVLTLFQDFLKKVKKQSKAVQYATPIEEKINLEQLRKEQNYSTEKLAEVQGKWFVEDDYLELLKMLDWWI